MALEPAGSLEAWAMRDGQLECQLTLGREMTVGDVFEAASRTCAGTRSCPQARQGRANVAGACLRILLAAMFSCLDATCLGSRRSKICRTRSDRFRPRCAVESSTTWTLQANKIEQAFTPKELAFARSRPSAIKARLQAQALNRGPYRFP